MRSTMDLGYVKGIDYIGGSASYRSTDVNGNANNTYFTVKASSGVVTPKSAGTAYLEVTIKGSQYKDTKTIRTPVQISNLATGNVSVTDVPIVTNVLLKPKEKIDIHWFIMNDKNASSSVSYTLGGVYVGL